MLLCWDYDVKLTDTQSDSIFCGWKKETSDANTHRYYFSWRSSAQFLFAVYFMENKKPSYFIVPHGVQKWLFARQTIISGKNRDELWSRWPMLWIIIFNRPLLGIPWHGSLLRTVGTAVPFPCLGQKEPWKCPFGSCINLWCLLSVPPWT